MPNQQNTGRGENYEDLRSRVLNMWSGFHGPIYTSVEIAAEFNISRNVVIGIVSRARALGDPRAVVRGPSPKPKVRKVFVADRNPARNGGGLFVRPAPVVSVSPPPEPDPEPDPVYFRSPAFCFSRNDKAKTVLNIGYDECHYPLESVTNDGFRMYCGLDASETVRNHQKAYCQEHYRRMFYQKAKTVRPGFKADYRRYGFGHIKGKDDV